MLSQFEFPEVDNIKIQITEPVSQDFIPCTNESKIGATRIVKDPKVATVEHAAKNFNHAQSLAKKPSEISPIVGNFLPSTKDVKVIEQNQLGLPQADNFVSPKHLKRKIINSHFDHQSKRKFPGPAGLLSGVLEEAKDESIGQIEFLSQVGT